MLVGVLQDDPLVAVLGLVGEDHLHIVLCAEVQHGLLATLQGDEGTDAVALLLGLLDDTAIVDSDEVGIHHLNLVFIRAAVTNERQLAAVLDELVGHQLLELLLLAALF